MDYELINLLFDVHAKAAGHPKLAKIANAAMAELEAIANPPVEEEAPAPKVKAIPSKPVATNKAVSPGGEEPVRRL